MPEWASTLIVVAVVIVIFLAMWWGWRSRVRRDAHLVPSHAVPAGLGEPIASARVLYAATTAHEQPLERLAITGLGFRAQGTLAVHRSGVVMSLDGSADVWIEASAIIGAQPAQTVIDKAVEKDGLLGLSWAIDETTVDSYFRVLEPEKTGALYDAIDSLTTAESEV